MRDLSALIVARSARIREGLVVLLRAIPQIVCIEQADGIPLATLECPERVPHLLLYDFESGQGETGETLRGAKIRWPQTRCVALVEHSSSQAKALAAGADVVLTKGILAADLLAAIEGQLHTLGRTEL